MWILVCLSVLALQQTSNALPYDSRRWDTLLVTACQVKPHFALMAQIQQGAGHIPHHIDMMTSHLLHIHDVNLLFHHIPEVLQQIESWWLRRLFEYTKLSVMFKKLVLGDLSFVTQYFVLLKATIRRRVHCGRKGIDWVRYMPNSDPSIQMLKQKLSLIRSCNVSQQSSVI